ncbi:SusC/RagA family TonB-linked outer membrane protein [Pedobacter borealis]|uniref:SusC/RagA family TonB-linked outer membrane protein n=1 Tax=Pedobacter borealis TaxID=475254 RepID=UPI000689EB9D|nr:TonB-dependent receptor [Pedobacter borealis]
MIKIYKPTDGDCRTTVPIPNRSFFNALFKFIYCSLFILIPIAASAQTVVTGTVKDEKGLPAVGTSVTETDVKNGTSVDANGKFTITLKGKLRVLNFTLVGYKTQRVTVGASNVVTVNLEEDLNKLNEVVVVGYGTQRKTDLTGSISSIKSEDLNLGGTTSNIGQAIQGKAAGVQVQQTSFAPGAGMSITVRGGNSINTTNSPLYVIDGFISDNGSTVNPNDIEDIQILKDASSAAIYGARGGNGVVLITTKKGKAGRVAIDLDLSNGNQFLTYKPSLLNGQQYTAIQNATAIEDSKPAPFPPSFAIANTNWLNEATQNASVHNRSLSISSGDQNSKIYVSGNYINQKGVLKGTGLEKYTARIGAEKNLNERLKLGANFYGSSSKVLQQSYSADITAPLFGLLTALPNIPVYNADGSYYRYQGKDNPLASLLEPTNTSTNKLANANLSLDYEIIKGLTYHLGGGAEYTQLTEGQYIPQTLSAGAKNGGIAAQKSSTTFRWLVENYLTYKYKTGLHDFTFLVGGSSQKDVNDFLGAGSKGLGTDQYLFYNLSAGSTPNGTSVTISNLGGGYSSFKEQATFNSLYGRLNYTYNDKLLASFTLRRDGSSKFGPNFRYGYFPSGAVAYKFTDEEFVKNLNTFSNLKLRASYGVTGNDRIPNYLYSPTFTNYSTVLNPGSPLQIGLEPKTLPNPNLKWESTTQFNVGLDMGFLNGRVNASIDLYAKKTTDLLLNIPLEQYWGFNSQLVNTGSIQNRGIEFLVNTVNIRNDNFTWNTNFNIALNRQKVLSLGPVNQISVNTANPSGTVSGREFSRMMPGRELGELFGYVYAGVIKTGETYAPQPGSKAGDPKYQDTNGDGKITPDDMTYLGNSTPRFTMGLGNDFHYKGFDINIFFQSSFGYSLYNMNRLVLESTTGADALNRFVAGANENTEIPREGYFLTTFGSYVNSGFVENASYLRLKSVSLGYTLPAKIFDRIKVVKGLRVYAEGQNIFTVTNYTGTDPEVNSHSGSNFGGGIDFNAFPAFRTFSAGVKLTIN